MKPAYLHLRRIRLTVAVVTALAFAAPVLGQQQDTKTSREREALRRSQGALHESQERESVLVKEKADLLAERVKHEDELQRAGSQLGRVRSDAAHSQSRAVQLAAELEALKVASMGERARIEESAVKQAQTSAERVAKAERLLAERTQAVSSLTGLLERAMHALTQAEEANRKLYAFGKDMIDQYRAAAPPENFLASESVIGFGTVRRENRAETLRSQVEAARVSASAPR
jgi:capsule polysaccharide export protein KpsE/RkpR